MPLWARISEAVAALRAGEGLSAALAKLSKPPESSVAFTIICIALGAKMAKADGRVSRSEVAAFRRVFTLPKASEAAAARVFDYAREDVAGFESYAAQAARRFGAGSATLRELLEALFIIAAADGEYHASEDAFLRRCAEIFGVAEADFRRLRATYAPDAADPWTVLGLDPGVDAEAVRARWRELARACHPDRLVAHGLPEEAVKLGAERMARINAAYEEIAGGG